MKLSELYLAHQGEGLLIGEPMVFVRTAGCNLQCSWCDSKFTWEPGYAYTDLSVDAIVAEVETKGRGVRWVSLTGGEPTIQKETRDLVRALGHKGIQVIVETNGLVCADWFGDWNVFVSCSPKLPGSGQDTPARRRKISRLVAARSQPAHNLAGVSAYTQWKFVIANESDLDILPEYCQSIGLVPSKHNLIYLQPDGMASNDLESYCKQVLWLQEHAPTWCRVSPQVHRILHGPTARGV